MTSASRPRRFTNAYGSNRIFRTGKGTLQAITPGWPPQPADGTYLETCFRDTPVKGTIRDGFRLPTPWRQYAYRLTPGSHDYFYLEGGWVRRAVGEWPSGGGVFAPLPKDPATGIVGASAIAISAAETAARNAIKNQDIDVGVALGEANETLAFMTQAITKLSSAYSAARKGDWTKAGKLLGQDGWKSIPNAWVSYNYGFRPLMQDIYGGAKALSEKIAQKGFLFSATGTYSENFDVRKLVNILSPNAEMSGNHTDTVRVKFWLRVDDPKLYGLSSLGLVNPLAIAWELTTLSFVVDWFVPVGNLLSSLTSAVGVTFVAGIRDNISSFDVKVRTARGGYLSGTKANCRVQQFASQRITYGYLPFVSAPVLLSGTGLSNLPRAVSAAALLSVRS